MTDSYEVLLNLVRNQLKSSVRIETELNILAEAPVFLPDAFLKAYKYVILDRNPPQNINECHSLIAYELGITTAHPGNISFHYPVQPGAFPDIDIDFSFPDQAKQYLKNKYGEDRVIGIPTYGRYRTRNLLKDLCRVVLDEDKNRIVSLDEINVLNKKLPFKIDQEVSSDILEDDEDVESATYELFTNTDMQDFRRKFPRIFEHFQKLYALPKYRGSHAAGLLILPEMARNTLPLTSARGNITAEFCEGQGLSELGSLGFIKMDILGLKTLKILETCNNFIVKRHSINDQTPSFCNCGRDGIACDNNYKMPMKTREATGELFVDLNNLCLNIRKVYETIGNMENQGVFQFEPEGISQFARHYGPKEFLDLALITSLYRPGPLDARLDLMGMPLDPGTQEFSRAKSAALFFVDRFHGKIPVYYPSEKVKSVLEKTYGILVFQEGISQCIMAMTNCTFMEAEKVRKFLTKVKPEAIKNDAGKIAELKSYEDKFKKQSTANNCSEKDIRAVWNLLVPFARYGFNLAHAVSYSLLSYQTGFCRTFYPLEYLTSLMIHNIDNTDKLVEYVRTAQKLGFKLLSPDLNLSQANFSINETNNIVCGLEFIKGVGEKASNEIINSRLKHGPFISLDDFLGRDISWRKVSVGVLEDLVKAGAFDSFAENRALTLAKIMVAKGKKKITEFETIDMFSDDKNKNEIFVKDFSDLEKSDHERAAFGFLLEDYIAKNKEKIAFALDVIKENARSIKKQATIGTISDIKELTQKNGAKYARLTVTNFDGVKESWLSFATTWNIFKNTLETGETYVALGKKDDKNTFIIDTVKTMNEILN